MSSHPEVDRILSQVNQQRLLQEGERMYNAQLAAEYASLHREHREAGLKHVLKRMVRSARPARPEELPNQPVLTPDVSPTGGRASH